MFAVKIQKMVALALGLSMFGFSLLAKADVTAPDTQVQNVVQELLVALRQEKSDKKKIQTLLDEKVLPLFDFTLITKRAVGSAWRGASAEQKKQLVDEFRDLLVRAFITKAFTDNGNRTVKFEPLKYTDQDDQLTLKSQILGQGQAPITVDYDLKKTAAGWKVVDLAIAGPRLALDIYNNQFREPLQQAGIEGLIKFLNDKNHLSDAGVMPTRKAETK